MSTHFRVRERRRTGPQNAAIRRMIDVLEWASELPPDRVDDLRAVARDTRRGAVSALRGEPLPQKPRPRPPLLLVIVAALAIVFLLALLGYGGVTY